MTLIASSPKFLPHCSLNLDYDRYAAGESSFFWIDREFRINGEEKDIPSLIHCMVKGIISCLLAVDVKIAHVKWLVDDGNLKRKFSLTAADDLEQILGQERFADLKLRGDEVIFLINIMAEGDLRQASNAVDGLIAKTNRDIDNRLQEIRRFDRVPDYPLPTRRIA